VVAFTGNLVASTALTEFHHVWWVLVASGICVSALSLVLPATRPGSRAASAAARAA
jgi:hypothetical protein